MKTQATAHPGMFIVEETAKNPAYQAYQLLHWGFVILPILAGLDKFFMRLTDWTQYLWPQFGNMVAPRMCMEIVGVIEIIAGFLVAFKPKIGAVIVAVWLWAIIANLLLLQNYYDIALRDFGLSLGALALARLACGVEHNRAVTSP